MDKLKKISLLTATQVIFILFSHLTYAASFDVNIPDRASTPGLQAIRDIELFIDLPTTTTGEVNFRVSRTSGTGTEFQDFTVSYIFDGDENGDSQTQIYSDDDGTGRNDNVEIAAASALTPTKRFKIHMQLNTNWNPVGCTDRQSNDETWTISTLATGGSAAPNIAAACINSYEVSAIIGCPRLLILATNTPATINPPSPGTQIPAITPCVDERPPVDVMLVLDKSGSMNWPVTGGSGNKILALNDAVNSFVDVWNQPGIAKAGDKLGVVLFNSDAEDWVVAPDLSAGLNSFTPDLNTAIKNNSITAGGATSIGDGLEMAANHLTAGTSTRKIILLMSDGRQNNDRRIAVVPDDGSILGASDIDIDGDGSNTDLVAVTHLGDGTDYQALPGISDLNIWSVSIGAPGTDIDATIFEQLASTGTGFYLNSEVDPDELNLFFLELLQNFLRFNTIETTRLINDSIPITRLANGDIGTTQLQVATTSTAKNISFSLMWDKTRGSNLSLTMQITPPAGDPISSSDEDSIGRIQQGPGFIRFTTALPSDNPHYPLGNQTGDWKVNISVQGIGLGKQFPYQFYALADDDIVKAKFSIANNDYTTGSAIPLQAKLTEFRKPLTDKDGSLKVFAKLIKPDEGIGNLLAENTVTITDLSSADADTDAGTPTQQKLDTLLQNNPDLLKYNSEDIPLFDDGLASHGDAVANDGIFNNLYKNTDKQGHYNFIFNVDGPTHGAGPISRQQIETVYVRLQPDPTETEISSSFTGKGPDRQLVVSMIPRDQFGNRFGPGYANQFLIAPINGIQPKFRDDNLDGIYEFTTPASADATLPTLDIRYVKPFIKVTDEMYPNAIPQSLTEPYIIDGLGSSKSSLSFHLGTNYPHGSFSNNFDSDISYAFDYEYRLSNKNSLLLLLGQNSFNNSFVNLDITNLSINAKHYFSPPAIGSTRYFLNGGVGYYSASPGDDDAGFNIGAGAQYPINNNYGLEAGYNYHLISSSPKVKFSTLQLGVYFNF